MTTPYKNWKDEKADLMAQAHSHYHQNTEAKLKAFVSTMKNPSLRVDLALTQNDLLECMDNNILTKILDDVKANRFFDLEADEVEDTSGWEQLGLALRYVKDNKSVERLVSFIACESVTGAAICTTILDALATFGLAATLCRAQAYVGQAACRVNSMGVKPSSKNLSPKPHIIIAAIIS